MRRLSLLTVTALAAASLTAGAVAATATPAEAATSLPLVADWLMNEPKGTANGPEAMVDASGHGLDGSVNVNVKDDQGQPDPAAPPRIVFGDTGTTGAAGNAYRFPPVTTDPATGLTLRDDNRLALVPDDPALDPLDRDFAAQVTFNTGAPSPNLVQKGQSGPNAPMFKIEVHERKASCTFAGFYGSVFAKRAIGMPTDRVTITANQWHTVRCERTYNATKNTEDIAITVDGVSSKASFAPPAGSTTVVGRIDSPYALSIGGKSSCDPAAGTGCDYFSGRMDEVRIEAAARDQAPTASFTSSCSLTACSFDSSSSSDSDGTIVSRAWSFGDGSSATGTAPGHTYAAAGTYPVSLTVEDDQGVTATSTQQLTVQAATSTGIAFRSSTTTTGSAATLKVALPAGVQAGDALLLQVATAGASSAPTPPAGWSEVTRQVFASSSALTVVWSRTATSADAGGGTFTVTLAGPVKSTGQVLAYAGTSTTAPVSVSAARADSPLTTSHTTPSVVVPTAGGRVVSFWTDKSSTTTAWTLPSAVINRAQSYGTGSGRLTTVIGDDGTTAPAGATAALTAKTDATSRAAMLTVVLAPR